MEQIHAKDLAMLADLLYVKNYDNLLKVVADTNLSPKNALNALVAYAVRLEEFKVKDTPKTDHSEEVRHCEGTNCETLLTPTDMSFCPKCINDMGLDMTDDAHDAHLSYNLNPWTNSDEPFIDRGDDV